MVKEWNSTALKSAPKTIAQLKKCNIKAMQHLIVQY